MITLLTPSKTMDFMTLAPDFVSHTQPIFVDHAAKIRAELTTHTVEQLQTTMHISRPLAEKVEQMYADTSSRKAALWTYVGDVFKGFQANTLTVEAASFAQDHLLIASAVYGVLRPSDSIQPYRLEMKAKLTIGSTQSVYEYWSNTLAEYVEQIETLQGELCVLSSEEYAKPITKHMPSTVRVVTPMFIDHGTNGKARQIPIYNKIMRGVMARWIVDKQIDSVDQLQTFSAHGYSYDALRSTANQPAFYRAVMKPLRFQ